MSNSWIKRPDYTYLGITTHTVECPSTISRLLIVLAYLNIQLDSRLRLRRKKKMTEFDKLVKMLDDAKIPYERNDDKDPNNTFFAYTGGHPMKRIMYGRDTVHSTKHDTICVCSAIWGYGSYGYEQGLIEIMGLLTPEEEECDSVKGWLTADDVFNRIKKHWEANNG